MTPPADKAACAGCAALREENEALAADVRRLYRLVNHFALRSEGLALSEPQGGCMGDPSPGDDDHNGFAAKMKAAADKYWDEIG